MTERWTDPEYAAEECARARRQADVARVEAREAREELARVTAERDEARAEVAALREQRQAARFAAMERPPEGRDPATRTRALLPACRHCRHCGDTSAGERACHHPDAARGDGVPLTPAGGTPTWCPLAKAGGA